MSRIDLFQESTYSGYRIQPHGEEPLFSLDGETLVINNCLEILEAKMLPWVELQWVHSVDEPEMEHTHFRFRLWEHVYLCNVGETQLLLTGAVSGEPLKPGELRELNVDFCS